MHPTRRNLLRTAALAPAILAPAILTLGSNAQAATLDEIRKRGSMVVATEDDFRPFEFVKDGTPTGFDTELLKLLRKTAGFEIHQEIIPWTGLLPGVNTGKYDAAVTAALITRERTAFLDFCSPVAEATDYYMKRKSDESITGIKDLSGKKCGVQAGSAMLSLLPDLEAMLQKSGGKMGEVVTYVSYPEAYQDLAIGRTDYVVNTVVNLQEVVREKPAVFALGQPVSRKVYIAWAVKKGNSSVLDFLNGFLMAQRRSGEMYRLQKEFLGTSFEDMPEHWDPA